MKPDASNRKTRTHPNSVSTSGKGGAGSVQRGVLLRGLRARRGYARKRQKGKLINQNGWCYWEGKITLLDEMIAFYAQENEKLTP